MSLVRGPATTTSNRRLPDIDLEAPIAQPGATRRVTVAEPLQVVSSILDEVFHKISMDMAAI